MALVSDILVLPHTAVDRIAPVSTSDDLEAFINPSLLSQSQEPTLRGASTRVATFIAAFSASLRMGGRTRAADMIAALSERPETRLGYTKAGFKGRGAGQQIAGRFVRALGDSRALDSGLVRDIGDAAILVPTVGPDTVSDIVTNLMLDELVAFTHQIMVDARVTVPFEKWQYSIWDPTCLRWEDTIGAIPIVDGRAVLFVPRDCVATQLEWTASGFLDYACKRAWDSGRDAVQSLLATVSPTASNTPTSATALRRSLCESASTAELAHRIAETHPAAYRMFKTRVRADKTGVSQQEYERISELTARRVKGAPEFKVKGPIAPRFADSDVSTPRVPDGRTVIQTRLGAARIIPVPSPHLQRCRRCLRVHRRDKHHECDGVPAGDAKEMYECSLCEGVVSAKGFRKHIARGCRVLHGTQ